MCEYQRIDPAENKMPKCVATGGYCTYCVCGNANTYKKAKEKEKHRERENGKCTT